MYQRRRRRRGDAGSAVVSPRSPVNGSETGQQRLRDRYSSKGGPIEEQQQQQQQQDPMVRSSSASSLPSLRSGSQRRMKTLRRPPSYVVSVTSSILSGSTSNRVSPGGSAPPPCGGEDDEDDEYYNDDPMLMIREVDILLCGSAAVREQHPIDNEPESELSPTVEDDSTSTAHSRNLSFGSLDGSCTVSTPTKKSSPFSSSPKRDSDATVATADMISLNSWCGSPSRRSISRHERIFSFSKISDVPIIDIYATDLGISSSVKARSDDSESGNSSIDSSEAIQDSSSDTDELQPSNAKRKDNEEEEEDPSSSSSSSFLDDFTPYDLVPQLSNHNTYIFCDEDDDDEEDVIIIKSSSSDSGDSTIDSLSEHHSVVSSDDSAVEVVLDENSAGVNNVPPETLSFHAASSSSSFQEDLHSAWDVAFQMISTSTVASEDYAESSIDKMLSDPSTTAALFNDVSAPLSSSSSYGIPSKQPSSSKTRTVRKLIMELEHNGRFLDRVDERQNEDDSSHMSSNELDDDDDQEDTNSFSKICDRLPFDDDDFVGDDDHDSIYQHDCDESFVSTSSSVTTGIGMDIQLHLGNRIVKGTYSGAIDMYGSPSGLGVVRFEDGMYYVGNVQCGEMHGHGCIVYPEEKEQRSYVMRGEFEKNKFVL